MVAKVPPAFIVFFQLLYPLVLGEEDKSRNEESSREKKQACTSFELVVEVEETVSQQNPPGDIGNAAKYCGKRVWVEWSGTVRVFFAVAPDPGIAKRQELKKQEKLSGRNPGIVSESYEED